MSFVVDCSVTMAWQLPDEGSSELSALFDRFLVDGAMVPGHWRLEVGNTLLMAERRKRIDATFRRDALADLSLLPFRVDPQTDGRAWNDSVALAVMHGLTVYDAAYLELALRERLPIATLDRQLARAAMAASVPLSIGT